MRGLPPRPVSILFLVVMTALLERHVWSTEKRMFPVVQIKKTGQQPEQRQEGESRYLGGDEKEDEDAVRKR